MLKIPKPRKCTFSSTGAVLLAFVLAATLASLLAGCATDSQAGKQAGRGAVYGAVGGAVAGAVSSAIFGGSIIGGAASGAAIGAASGAATGAVAGAMSDSERKQMEAKAAQPQEKPGKGVGTDPKFAELEKEIGKKNFEAATLIADCKHGQAIGTAVEAYAQTQDSKQRAYALMIQAIAAEEMGDKDMAASLYPRIAQAAPSIGTPEKARTEALEGVMGIQKIRKDYGLPPLCSNLK